MILSVAPKDSKCDIFTLFSSEARRADGYVLQTFMQTCSNQKQIKDNSLESRASQGITEGNYVEFIV